MSEQQPRPGFRTCTEISAICTVERTVLGYYPNFGANVFFTVAFGIVAIASFSLGTWKRTWTFMAAVTAGCILETAGYATRILLNKNPWNTIAFQTQICAIILGPTLICVAIYLTLKHVSLHLNPDLSRVRPRWYPIIFLPADLSCLVIQAIGGGLAAAGRDNNQKLRDGGNRAIIAGIVLQVVVLLAFAVTGVDYWIRVARWVKTPEANPQAVQLWKSRNFRLFIYGVSGAFFAILLRCIYRIAEMAGGWGNHIMQDEISFVILDSSLVLITVSLLTIFHPGIFFPLMATGAAKPSIASDSSTAVETETETEEKGAAKASLPSSQEGPKKEVV